MEVLKELDKINYTFMYSDSLSDVIKLSDDEIREQVFTIVVDYQMLSTHFDEFIRVIKILESEGVTVINCESYECVKFINKHYNEKFPMIINVLDDFQNKDRSDIKLSELDKTIITVPISHLMWGIDFDNLVYTNSLSIGKCAIYFNGNKEISLENLKRIKEVVESLKGKDLTDAQKLLVVSAYLQRHVQYVDNIPDLEINGEIYTLDDKTLTAQVLDDEVGLVETIINKHYGLCMGISNATTMLLNNPQMNIDARTILNEEHAWNIIKIDGKYYYCDNTWAITRNPHLFKDAILAQEFNPEFLLFGKRTLNEIEGHEAILSENPNNEKVSYRDYRLEKTLKNSKQLVTGAYSKNPVLTMHRKA